MISKSKNNVNPNLKFETFVNFKKKLDYFMEEQENNNNINNQRPL